MRKPGLVVSLVLAAAACRGHRHAEATPVAPSRLVAFLPPAPLGWTAGKTMTATPEESHMRPPASMAGRQYSLDTRSFSIAVIDPAWKQQLYAMYMSSQGPNGTRRIEAPFEKIDDWPAFERQYEEGDRELNVVVERYIVSLTTRSEDFEFLQKQFRAVDARALSKLE